jgi:hypothetical protein
MMEEEGSTAGEGRVFKKRMCCANYTCASGLPRVLFTKTQWLAVGRQTHGRDRLWDCVHWHGI